jgi:hypothetical protein
MVRRDILLLKEELSEKILLLKEDRDLSENMI